MGERSGEQPGLEQVGGYLRQWRAEHPRASLTEIEGELDRQLRRIRAEVVAETAVAGARDLGVCPTCGGSLRRRGDRTRTLITDGDAAITLQRPYASCPVCTNGLFPPG